MLFGNCKISLKTLKREGERERGGKEEMENKREIEKKDGQRKNKREFF